jgi:hypothetical protein
MTIVLGTGSAPISDGARYTASALSIIVAFASVYLMHNQCARAISHAELAKRISYKLSLTNLLGGSFGLRDAVPDKGADTQNVWATNRVVYGIWVGMHVPLRDHRCLCNHLSPVGHLVVYIAREH